VSTPISEIFASHCTNESPPSCIKARDLTADDPLYREQQDGIKTYLTDPKHLIFVMLQLAKVVQDSPKIEGSYITKERSFEVYSVTTLDLQNIRKALDTMELYCGKGNEAGLFELPTDIIFPRYVAKTGVENDTPRDSEELSDLIVAGSMKENGRSLTPFSVAIDSDPCISWICVTLASDKGHSLSNGMFVLRCSLSEPR
jgi:hypothetical protein